MKDEIIRDEGPFRESLGAAGCSGGGEDAGSDGPVEEVEQCGALHAVIKCQLLSQIVQQ